MSMLSKFTGIGINPFGKDKVKISTKSIANSPLGKAAPYIAGAALIPGLGGALGGLISKIPGVGALGGALGGLVRGGGLDDQGNWGLAGDLGGLAGRLGGGMLPGGGGGFGLNSLIPLGLAGAQVANAAELGRKADKFANEGWDISKGHWDANEVLRNTGRSGLLRTTGNDPARPFNVDMSGLNAIRGQIPGGVPQGGLGLGMAASALTGGSGTSGSAPPQSPMTPPGLMTSPLKPNGLAGGGPTPPESPISFPGKPGFHPTVRY